jgi:hypothetical protein
MDEKRDHAYRVVLSAGMLHLKWDLACLLGGFAWFNPRRALRQIRAARNAARRAVAFHNLAISAADGFSGFSEESFWDGVERFERRDPGGVSSYRELFERCLRGETVRIITPSPNT